MYHVDIYIYIHISVLIREFSSRILEFGAKVTTFFGMMSSAQLGLLANVLKDSLKLYKN